MMRLWTVVSAVFMSYMTFVLVTVFFGFILEANAFHEYPSAKRLKKEEQKCTKIFENYTPTQCEQRLQHCCKPGKNAIKKPVCATTSYGFGMVFYNPCSLHYIRCMYPTICFLKRAMDNPHRARYQVMRQDKPFELPCSVPRNKNITSTTPEPRSKLYQGDPNSPERTPNPDEDRYRSPLYDIRTIPTSSMSTTGPSNTTTQYLPESSPKSYVKNRTTSLPSAPTTNSSNVRTTVAMPTTYLTTVVTCENLQSTDFTYTVSVRDAKFKMDRINHILQVRTSDAGYDEDKPEKSLYPKCMSPPPAFSFCDFPLERDK